MANGDPGEIVVALLHDGDISMVVGAHGVQMTTVFNKAYARWLADRLWRLAYESETATPPDGG